MAASIALLILGLWAVLGVINARRPARTWWLMGGSWIAAWVATELAPHLVLAGTAIGVVLVALGALQHTVGWIGLAGVVIADAVAIPLILRALKTAAALEEIVDELDPHESVKRYPRRHIAFPFLPWRRRDIRRLNGIRYRGRSKLDVYLPPSEGEEPRPAIVHVHGGAWMIGSRREQGVPLLGHLAANGWVGFNVDYRLSPRATWPDHLDDIRAAIDWVREHADEYGVDPSFIAITGGSAGGHLSALAGLTIPGIAACVPFYGVYDLVDEERRHVPTLQHILERYVFKVRRRDDPDRYRDASPSFRVHADAPPFFVIHGESDSLVPVEEARAFVERLREVSNERVLYAEMRGGQHAFDVIPSWRTIPVIEAIERFLATVRAARSGAGTERAAS
ncbi:MAG TPA: alpha/beta hydrolase [Solirubrobacteraceae bacterium]